MSLDFTSIKAQNIQNIIDKHVGCAERRKASLRFITLSCTTINTAPKKTHAPVTEKMLYRIQLQLIIFVSLCYPCCLYLLHSQETERAASEDQPNGKSNLNKSNEIHPDY